MWIIWTNLIFLWTNLNLCTLLIWTSFNFYVYTFEFYCVRLVSSHFKMITVIIGPLVNTSGPFPMFTDIQAIIWDYWKHMKHTRYSKLVIPHTYINLYNQLLFFSIQNSNRTFSASHHKTHIIYINNKTENNFVTDKHPIFRCTSITPFFVCVVAVVGCVRKLAKT